MMKIERYSELIMKKKERDKERRRCDGLGLKWGLERKNE